MPLKLNVGFGKKVGQPSFGSLSANCSLECELDASAVVGDLDELHQRANELFLACSQAVHAELARQQAVHAHNSATTSVGQQTMAHRNGSLGPATTNGQDRYVSGRQLGYAMQLARQIRGLGANKLDTLAERLHGTQLFELSRLEASSLIDTLKAIKEGRVDVNVALVGDTT
jgi:hypothetical protein